LFSLVKSTPEGINARRDHRKTGSPPDGSSQIDSVRAGQTTRGRADRATDQSAGKRAAASDAANRRARAGTDQATRHSAITRAMAATGQKKPATQQGNNWHFTV
jgi:hypothetical protein